MLVYGDQQESADPRRMIAAIRQQLQAIGSMKPGLERHTALVAALVDGGRLQQGVADWVFEQSCRDEKAVSVDAIGGFLRELGAAVCLSWDSGYSQVGKLPALHVAGPLPTQVDLRLPEGFAFYALYPEAYIEAARRLRLDGPAEVIGIRSIGTALAAVVAAALDAPQPVTVRPFGDPSDRKVRIDTGLEKRLAGGDAGHFVIVDEGPGQSGSSFAAVADWLRARGVPDERIAFLPSHPGSPGASATEERRKWWRKARREPGDFGDRWEELVATWTEETIGQLDGPLVDLSAGAWREQRFASEKQWPPVVQTWERRKFLASRNSHLMLVKFAGLGSLVTTKLEIARALHAEDLVPEPVGVAQGFFVERWHGDAAPIGDEKPVAEIGRYIGTRARLLPASSGGGADAAALLRMARRNIGVELGEEAAAAALASWEARGGDLNRLILRVKTDNRMQPHEWIRTPAGHLLKTDAVDHHQSHDLIGCQDMAWDVAGAIVEFAVDEAQAERLTIVAGDYAGRRVDRDLLTFYLVAYPAFRLGQMRLGETMTSDADERRRLRMAGDRYAALLQPLLQSGTAATPLESLVD